MNEQKKPYTPPTLTQHGNAVKETKGFGGRFWEVIMGKPVSDVDIEDDL